MAADTLSSGPRPPLSFAWRASIPLAHAVAGTNALYGIAQDGTIVALDPVTGAMRWQTSNTYLTRRLSVVGDRLYAFRKEVGLTTILDTGNAFEERTLVSINPVSENAHVSQIVVDLTSEALYFGAQQALLAISRTGILLGGTDFGPETPHATFPAGVGQIITVDGYGFPSLWVYNNKTFIRRWQNILPGLGPARAERTALVSGNRVYCTQESGVTCVRLDNGATLWRNPSIPVDALALDGNTLYAIGPSAQVWALDAESGQVKWDRMYLYGTTETTDMTVAAVDGLVYVGALVRGGPATLFVLNGTDGTFLWQSNSAQLAFGAGLALVTPSLVLTYGDGTNATAMGLPARAPMVQQSDLSWSPNPLRGATSEYSGRLRIHLDRSATVSAAAWRETTGRGALFINGQRLNSGDHEITWNAGGAGGFTSSNQFGKIAVDVTEDGGLAYTVTQLVPVNTLPDIQHHWAKQNIETMLYHKHISGYPDMTFKPDNLLTRAESCTIIAKTLGLNGPGAGFQTKFTDIGSHWARPFIMALEELGTVGGFQEPDGSFTFRPDLNMTRAQEASILVRAYKVPAAPSGFATRFADIAGHWARPAVEALEAAGYINGFREENGTFTYRPEQNLTRAELSALVVRILRLTRP